MAGLRNHTSHCGLVTVVPTATKAHLIPAEVRPEAHVLARDGGFQTAKTCFQAMGVIPMHPDGQQQPLLILQASEDTIACSGVNLRKGPVLALSIAWTSAGGGMLCLRMCPLTYLLRHLIQL